MFSLIQTTLFLDNLFELCPFMQIVIPCENHVDIFSEVILSPQKS